MEFVPLSDVTLRTLALDDPVLKRVFHGVHPSDGLPSRPPRTTRAAYIVNTDPRGEPGQHWLGLWTEKNRCEVMDSYGLPITTYQAPDLEKWIEDEWDSVQWNDRTLQALNSTACGHYALMFLKDRVRGRTMHEFVQTFSPHDFVANDRTVGRQVRRQIVKEYNALPSLQCCTPHELILRH